MKVGRSSASVPGEPGTRVQQKKRHPRIKSYEKKKLDEKKKQKNCEMG